MKRLAFAILLITLSLVSAEFREADAQRKSEVCIYTTDSGEQRIARSIHRVPTRFRGDARCIDEAQLNPYLAAPGDIELRGNIRREDMSSSIGRIQLRWPRSVESLFGRNPMRATADAAQTVSRVLRTAAFPSELQSLNLDWQIVFMDENLPETQIPSRLISNCHPGWMTPPANIYIVAQRVAAGCGNAPRATPSVADAELTQVLIHEMAHAVEFIILGGVPGSDRIRAEGFASWFEMHAADYSSILDAREIRRQKFTLARLHQESNPGDFPFIPTADAYSRSALYFAAIVDRRGIRGLMDVYKTMSDRRMDFFPAIEQTLNWNRNQLEQEVSRLLERR